MDDRHNTEKSLPTAGEKSGPTAGRKEHSQLQARTKQRRLAAADRPQGSTFRKGRSQDTARDVTRIRRAAQRRRQLSRRVWDARQARQEEHRLRDPVHLQAGRNGASGRSSASEAGVKYSADHEV